MRYLLSSIAWHARNMVVGFIITLGILALGYDFFFGG